MTSMRNSLTAIFVALIFTHSTYAATPAPATDVVVYGGTASGVMAAYSSAREGLHVVLLEPGGHVGGMVSGGLSATDLGHFTIIGGYARDFYLRAAAHDGLSDLNVASNWLSEPHVDEEIFLAMLKESGVEVHFHERLREHGGVRLVAKKVTSITTEDGKEWSAKIFIDCSYEGDLMAEAGVSYVIGREATAEFHEELAGIRAKTSGHQFKFQMDAYDDENKLLPEIDAEPLGAPGSGDQRVQAYNFRVILTHDAANMIPFPRPDGYDPGQFALLKRYLKQFRQYNGREPRLKDVTLPVLIPNNKADFNNNGPFSTDFIGHSWKYPDGTYAEKAEIWQQHLLYTKSYFYFLANDPSVPASLRAEMNTWGLPKDEFADTEHWPYQLYIREGRRMRGAYVMHQADLQTDRTKSDSIAMGSYNSDSHHVRRLLMPDGSLQNEGNMEVPVQPYEIPYRAITPQRLQGTNLLVPVCFSATHVAYSSMRMEPQYMMMGQAAGDAAALAIHTNKDVQDISIDALQKTLRVQHAILSLSEESSAATSK